MMKLECLSDHLKATRSRLKEFRHGGIVLTGEPLESFIRRFDRFVEMAILLENEISRREWNDRARVDREQLMQLGGGDILDAMRTTGRNVVPFRRPAAPPEGDGAA